MPNSINLIHEVKMLRDANESLKQRCSTLSKENEVLRRIVSEEVLRRLQLDELCEAKAVTIKSQTYALIRIKEALNSYTRKEEFVKSLNSILSELDF